MSNNEVEESQFHGLYPVALIKTETGGSELLRQISIIVATPVG